jgi:predicted nucleic acid-binding protein
MVYVDTSVLVALHLNESGSARVARWYAACGDELASAAWCVTEFASALSIKRRTGQIDASLADQVWERFERQCANELRLLHVSPAAFHAAADLIRDPSHGLRSGDGLHLAIAVEAGVKSVATLDGNFAKNARRLKLGLALR